MKKLIIVLLFLFSNNAFAIDVSVVADNVCGNNTIFKVSENQFVSAQYYNGSQGVAIGPIRGAIHSANLRYLRMNNGKSGWYYITLYGVSLSSITRTLCDNPIYPIVQ